MPRLIAFMLCCVLNCAATQTLFADSAVTLISQVRDTYPQQSPDGTRVVFQSNRSGGQQIWIMNADGSAPRQLTQAQGEGAETPTWSPDGEHIAYAVYLGEGNNDVFTMRADGSEQQQRTFEPGYDDHPHWPADGTRIVFNSDRDTPDPAAPWEKRWHDIWSMDAGGSNLVKHTQCKSACTYGSLSPDGKSLLYRRVDDSVGLNWALEAGSRNSEIYLAGLASGDTRNLAPHPAFEGWPAWSPDGAWIVFASNRSGPALSGQLWLVRPDGSDLRQLTNDEWSHAQPAWAASGDAITAYRFQEKASGEYGGIALIPLGSAGDCQDLDAILALNATAQGSDRLAEVTSVRHRLRIKEPTFEVDGTYVASRAGSMRIDIQSDGQHVFSEGLDAGGAWQWSPETGVSAQSEAGAEALLHGIEMPGHFYTLQAVRERGAGVTLVGAVTEGERSEWQIHVVMADGFERDYFIDQSSHRLTRLRDRRAFHPDVDPTQVTVETRYEDPEWVDGVLVFMRHEQANLDTGEWLGTTRVQSIEFNLPDIATLLQRP